MQLHLVCSQGPKGALQVLPPSVPSLHQLLQLSTALWQPPQQISSSPL